MYLHILKSFVFPIVNKIFLSFLKNKKKIDFLSFLQQYSIVISILTRSIYKMNSLSQDILEIIWKKLPDFHSKRTFSGLNKTCHDIFQNSITSIYIDDVADLPFHKYVNLESVTMIPPPSKIGRILKVLVKNPNYKALNITLYNLPVANYVKFVKLCVHSGYLTSLLIRTIMRDTSKHGDFQCKCFFTRDMCYMCKHMVPKVEKLNLDSQIMSTITKDSIFALKLIEKYPKRGRDIYIKLDKSIQNDILFVKQVSKFHVEILKDVPKKIQKNKEFLKSLMTAHVPFYHMWKFVNENYDEYYKLCEQAWVAILSCNDDLGTEGIRASGMNIMKLLGNNFRDSEKYNWQYLFSHPEISATYRNYYSRKRNRPNETVAWLTEQFTGKCMYSPDELIESKRIKR